jgi:hypothetical protein
MQKKTTRLGNREYRVVVPAEMKAAAIDKFGPPSVLKLCTVPVPRPGPHEVLVAVHAAGVGVWDAQLRDGSWAEGDTDFPLILGKDGAGVIVEMGERVRRFDVGDRVWAYQYENPKGGFGAEYVVVDADHVGALPSHLTMLEGGTAAVTGLTALQGCDDNLGVRRGETVMIFGASGAVGTLAVQFVAVGRGGDTRRAIRRAISKGAGDRDCFRIVGRQAAHNTRRRCRHRRTPPGCARSDQACRAGWTQRDSRVRRQPNVARRDEARETRWTGRIPEWRGAGTETKGDSRDRLRRGVESGRVRAPRTGGRRVRIPSADRRVVFAPTSIEGARAHRTWPRGWPHRVEGAIATRVRG